MASAKAFGNDWRTDVKMTPSDYSVLRDAVQAITTTAPDARQKYLDSGLSDRRFIWDAFTQRSCIRS